MPFTVDDFNDLVRLLEERPEWRARLRDLLLPKELIALPAVVAQLVEASRLALERLGRIEQRLDSVDRRLDGVVRWQGDADRRFDHLDEGMRRMSSDVNDVEGTARRSEENAVEVAAALRRLENDVGELRGSTWETRFRIDPDFWFSELIAAPVALSGRHVAEMLHHHVAEGRLTPAEAAHIRRTDIVIEGVEAGEPAYLIVEVSRTVSTYDVQRAADRAILLRKAAPRVRAVAAGKFIRSDAVELAERRGVVTEVEDVVGGYPLSD